MTSLSLPELEFGIGEGGSSLGIGVGVGVSVPMEERVFGTEERGVEEMEEIEGISISLSEFGIEEGCSSAGVGVSGGIGERGGEGWFDSPDAMVFSSSSFFCESHFPIASLLITWNLREGGRTFNQDN